MGIYVWQHAYTMSFQNSVDLQQDKNTVHVSKWINDNYGAAGSNDTQMIQFEYVSITEGYTPHLKIG